MKWLNNGITVGRDSHVRVVVYGSQSSVTCVTIIIRAECRAMGWLSTSVKVQSSLEGFLLAPCFLIDEIEKPRETQRNPGLSQKGGFNPLAQIKSMVAVESTILALNR